MTDSKILELEDFLEFIYGKKEATIPKKTISYIMDFINDVNIVMCVTNHETGELHFLKSQYAELFRFELNNKPIDLFNLFTMIREDEKEDYFTMLQCMKKNVPCRKTFSFFIGNLGKTPLVFETVSIPLSSEGDQQQWTLVSMLLTSDFISIQRKMVEREVHYLKTLELTPYGVAIHDGSTILFVNSQIVKIMEGESPADLVGKSVLSFVHPDYRDLAAARMSDVINLQVDALPVEEKFITLKGNIVDIEVAAMPVYYSGKLSSQIICKDISERKEKERQLQASEQKLKGIFEHSPLGQLLVNTNGEIISANRIARDMLNTSSWENSLISDYFEGNPIQLLDLKIGVSITPQRIVLNDNPCRLYGVKLSEEEILLILEDLREQEKLQNELKMRQKLDMLSILASGLSHDFNNILTSVLGNLELFRLSTDDLTGDLADILDSIESSLNRGKEMVNKLQSLGQGVSVIETKVSMTQVINEVFSVLEPRMKAVNYTVHSSDDYFIMADYNDVFQVFFNLILNAVDAVESSPSKQIDVLISQEEHDIVVEVRDSGVGIAPKNMGRIFDPFFSTKEHTTVIGRGLGLPSSLTIVRKLGGNIQVSSKLGVGTTFKVNIPLAPPEVIEQIPTFKGYGMIHAKETSEVSTKRPLLSKKTPSTLRPRLLIVDSDPNVLKLIQNCLSDLDVELETVTNGYKAIQIFQNRGSEFNGVLIDLMLRDVNGTIVLENMVRIRPDLTDFLIMSSRTLEKIPPHLKLVTRNVLSKPFSIPALREKVEDMFVKKTL